MIKRILSVVILVAILATSICAFAEPETAEPQAEAQQTTEATTEATGEAQAEPAAPEAPAYVPIKTLMEQSGMATDDEGKKHPVEVTSAAFDAKEGIITFVISNASDKDYKAAYIIECDENSVFQVMDMQQYSGSGNTVTKEERMCSGLGQLTIEANGKATIKEKVIAKGKKAPVFNIFVQYSPVNAVASHYEAIESGMGDGFLYREDITNPKNLKAAAGGSGAVFGKIVDYILDNIIALIALILSAVLLVMNLKKNCKDVEVVETSEEVSEEESAEEVAEESEVTSEVEVEDAIEEASEEDAEKEETEE